MSKWRVLVDCTVEADNGWQAQSSVGRHLINEAAADNPDEPGNRYPPARAPVPVEDGFFGVQPVAG